MKKIIFPAFLLILLPLTFFGQEMKPTETEALLNVEVINKNSKSKEGELIELVAQKTGKKYRGITGTDGKFSLLVPEGDKYKVIYKAFNASDEQQLLDIPSEDGSIVFDFSLIIETPKVFTLDNVLFETGKSVLKPESIRELNELAEFMSRKKSLTVEIAGHTDNVGNKESNQKLSEERAEAVKNFLIKKGIEPVRLTSKGYGDSQPVADNNTDQGRRKNRRTEARVITE